MTEQEQEEEESRILGFRIILCSLDYPMLCWPFQDERIVQEGKLFAFVNY